MPPIDVDDLVVSSPSGLFCPKGNFYIDPWRSVDRALVTHAHSDHTRWGMKSYLCAEPGKALVAKRSSYCAPVEGLPYGQKQTINDVSVSFHPAGHILGSAQVRIEHRGDVWVVSGDYKVGPDSTCAPFEPVRCNVFFSESTFGLPIYHWKPQTEIFAEINQWWRENVKQGKTSLLFAYALGKAQRLLSGLDPSIGPILVHGAVAALNPLYKEGGVNLPDTLPADAENAALSKGQAIVIAPPSVQDTPWMRKWAPASTAFASGWMQLRGTRRNKGYDRGFALSDHADWPGLLWAIKETGASRIGVMHGNGEALIRYLKETGMDAAHVETEYGDEDVEPEKPVAA